MTGAGVQSIKRAQHARPGWVGAVRGAGDGGARVVGRVGRTTVGGMTKPQVIHLVIWGFADVLGGDSNPNLLTPWSIPHCPPLATACLDAGAEPQNVHGRSVRSEDPDSKAR
ncbi:hypothetical protein GCM10022235_52860 [Kribbella ginsengisoli]|uniref:Uncharacterized protein n=1 Tax=Kribbella ginsengisoli TaxID=363865 RepID=A0ABP6Y2V4_9ACTN